MEGYFVSLKRLIDEASGSAAHWFPAKIEGEDRNGLVAGRGEARAVLNLGEFIARQ